MKEKLVMMEGFYYNFSDSNFSNDEKYNENNNEDKNGFDNT